jgi:outer membrane protein
VAAAARGIRILALSAIVMPCNWSIRCQTAPLTPDRPWHSPREAEVEHDARQMFSQEFGVDGSKAYTLAELIDMAETHNPETRQAWAAARSRAESLGIARSELFPTLAATVISRTSREEVYFQDRFYRQTSQSFDLALALNYTVFDFGGRAGRIDDAKAALLVADFEFNDVHSKLIYLVEAAYYRLLNAVGQETAAEVNLANAVAVQQAAEARMKNGLSTLPDVLEAQSATAQAQYDLQAAQGAEDIARGELATELGTSPLHAIQVQPVDQLFIPDETETSVDQEIDRALSQRPDLMERVAAIRFADAQIRESRSAYFPSLQIHALPNAQSLFGLQQTFPWGTTSGLDGEVGFNLDWTIFDGGTRKHQLSKARDEARVAEARANATREEVENGVWTAYFNLKTAFRQRAAATALLRTAEESYNAALESYHEGVRNLLDLSQAQQTLARARSTDVLARTQVLTALADLAFATGDDIQPTPARARP